MQQMRIEIGIYVVAVAMACTSHAQASGTPLKVYILAGQSNMEGHARIETFDYIGEDPATAPILKEMVDADGQPITCDNVWISYYTGGHKEPDKESGEGSGKLTAGYGARGTKFGEIGSKIGPEFTFGIYMQKHVEEPILIIKTAWGGKSLHTDYRSPSAGRYKPFKQELEKLAGKFTEQERQKWHAEKKARTGLCYRLMIEHVKKVLADPKRVYPAYDAGAGYEIAGFAWFQGFNDLVGAYPKADDPETKSTAKTIKDYSEYSRLLGCFIRDVRQELSAPDMRFVIGVLGVGGEEENPGRNAFRKAMAAPAALPEFKGNVVAVETAPFWEKALARIDAKRGKVKQMGYFLRSKHKNHANKDGNMDKQAQNDYLKKFREELITPEEEDMWRRGASNGGYHYLGCAKTFALIGKAFADAMVK
mgnify:CR=1 FL=1